MASFTLEVTFSGLCMFVPSQDKQRMHVLMPVTHHHPHEMRVLYHPAYDTGTGNPNKSEPPQVMELAGEAIELAGAGTLDATLKPGIGNASNICGRKVPPELLTGPPQGPVAARVSMTSGDYTLSDGLIWDIDGADTELSNIATWTMTLPEAELTLSLNGEKRTLHPIDGRIAILVFHVPPTEFPAVVPLEPYTFVCPPVGTEAHHFPAFYDLLKCTHDLPTYVKPKYDSQCSMGGSGARSFGGSTPRFFGVSPVTCMLGGGNGGP